MRILLTVHQFLPDHLSGTEILALETARELHRRGHAVTVYTGYPSKTPLKDHERFDEYIHEGILVRRFLHQYVPMGGQSNVVEMEYRNDLFGKAFRNYLAAHRPDLVHAFHLSRLTTTVIDACIEAHVPIIFTATDFWSICPMNQLRLPDGSLCDGPNAFASNCVRHIAEVVQPGTVADRMRVLPDVAVAAAVVAIQNRLVPERWFFPLVRAVSDRPAYVRQRINAVDRILTPTHIMAQMLTRNGVHPSIMRYVPYGVNLHGMKRNTDKGRCPALRIGFVGTLVEHKGCHVLIEAVRSIPETVPVELRIHGKLTEFPAYVERLRQLIGDDWRITLAGPFSSGCVSEVHEQTDVLVCPSLWYENTPLVIYEAMAAGVPVVATDLGGMSESVNDGVNGLLFALGNRQELAGHLLRLAKNRDLLRSMSRATTIPRGVPEYVAQMEDIYREVLAQRPRTQMDAK